MTRVPSSLLRRARPLMVARFASAALTIGVPMVLARVLVPAEYGTYREAILASNTLYLVLPMGITLSLYYFVPREPGLQAAFIGQTLVATTAAGVAAAALLLAARPLLVGHFGNAALGAMTPWIAAFTLFTLAGTSLDIALNATGAVAAAALARAGTEVARAAAMVAGTLLTRSLSGALAGLAVAAGVRAALTWAWVVRAHGLTVSWPALRRQLAYALPFGLAALALTAQQQFHQYVVGGAVVAAAFAVYNVGCFQLPVVDVLYTPVSEVLQLGLADLDRQGRPCAGLALFQEAVSRLSLAFVPLVALLLVVAPAFIGFVFSDRYLAAVPLFRLSLLAIPLAALPLDGVMRARAQNRFMLGASLVKLAVTIALVLTGFRAFGMEGALGGFVAAEVVNRAMLLARAARLFETGLAGVLPWGDLARQGLAAALATPFAWAALHAVHAPRVVLLAAAGSSFAAVYGGVLWWRGWLPPEWRARPRDSPPSPRPRLVPAGKQEEGAA